MNVSIIVLTCNQREYTLALVRSLIPWLHDNPGSELIIIDNGSTDGTRSAVADLLGSLASQLQYFYNERNLGVAGGRNIGLRNARKDYILILDNDTVVTPEALDALRDHLSANPRCGLCGPALISPEGNIQASAKPFPGLGIKLRHVLSPLSFGLIESETDSEKGAMQPGGTPLYLIGACQMFRREIIDRIGLLDERIFYGPEDADWCIRIAAEGFTIDYLPTIRIIHHWQRATTRNPFSRLSRLHARALLYFYRKHHRIR